MRFTDYLVTVEFTEPVLGTVPKNADVYTRFIATKAENPAKEAEEAATVPDNPDDRPGWTGFHTDDDGPFVYNYAWMGFLKEAGNTLKDELKVKNLRSKLDNYVKVYPRKIRPDRGLDGYLERPLRAMTMQGPRVTVVRSDRLPAETQMTFAIRVLQHKELTETILQELMAFGEFHGFNQWRNGGYGTFRVLAWRKSEGTHSFPQEAVR